MKNKEIDHEFTDNIICPYCGYEERDSFEYSDNDETECPDCEQTFKSQRHVRITYSTSKIEQ